MIHMEEVQKTRNITNNNGSANSSISCNKINCVSQFRMRCRHWTRNNNKVASDLVVSTNTSTVVTPKYQKLQRSSSGYSMQQRVNSAEKRPLSLSVDTDNLVRSTSAIMVSSSETASEHQPRPDEIKSKSQSHESVLKEGRVLYAIPTAEARRRNFLQGKVAFNSSLLGTKELQRLFPTRQLTIFIGTWNMNGQPPPKELNDFVLPMEVEHVPDMLVFATQESWSEKFEWEVALQETIGPSHILLHSAALGICLAHPQPYLHGTIYLLIFIRRDLIWYVSTVEDASLSVRPGVAFRTKGAVACGLMLFGTSFLFVSAHLTAHQERVKERVADVARICNALDLPRALPSYRHRKARDCTQNFDYIFWAGDLNFRLATPRADVLDWLENTSFPLPPHLPHGYLHHDQLCAVLEDGAAFHGFTEANIRFPPTYKYDTGTQQTFDTSAKQRTPAYTDRILYKVRRGNHRFSTSNNNHVQCTIYDSVSSITTSDHKPVWGVFRATLKPGLDTIPLAAGLFLRDVYIEGLKRRAAATHGEKGDDTMVCSLQ